MYKFIITIYVPFTKKNSGCSPLRANLMTGCVADKKEYSQGLLLMF